MASGPALAVLSAIMFFSVMVSYVLLSAHLLSSSDYPLISIHGEGSLLLDYNSTELEVTIIHERGRPVEIREMVLYVGDQRLSIPPSQLRGQCRPVIRTGDRCVFTYLYPRLLRDEPVRAVVIFDAGTYPVSFTPVSRFKVVKNTIPASTFAFTRVSITHQNLSGIVTYGFNLSSLGAEFISNSSGILLYDANTSTLFGGLGFAYYSDLNIEYNLSIGAWALTLFRLVNHSTLPFRVGYGVFYDHASTAHPEELIAFVGVMVNRTGAYLVIERYDRDQGLEQALAAVPLNATLEYLYSNPVFIAAYIVYNTNLNFYSINATVYRPDFTPLASVSGAVARLPGTPGQTWYHRLSAVVQNSAAFYEFLFLARHLIFPNIVFEGVPANHFLDIEHQGALWFRMPSTGGPIYIRAYRLPAGTRLIIRFPAEAGMLPAFIHTLQRDVEEFTVIRFNSTAARIDLYSDGEIAAYTGVLPVLGNDSGVSGVLATRLFNRYGYPVRVRVMVLPEHSGIPLEVHLHISLYNSTGAVQTQSILIANGTVNPVSTDWSPPVGPGDVLYVYIQGYYRERTSNATRLLLLIETAGVNERNEPDPVLRDERPLSIEIHPA